MNAEVPQPGHNGGQISYYLLSILTVEWWTRHYVYCKWTDIPLFGNALGNIVSIFLSFGVLQTLLRQEGDPNAWQFTLRTKGAWVCDILQVSFHSIFWEAWYLYFQTQFNTAYFISYGQDQLASFEPVCWTSLWRIRTNSSFMDRAFGYFLGKSGCTEWSSARARGSGGERWLKWLCSLDWPHRRGCWRVVVSASTCHSSSSAFQHYACRSANKCIQVFHCLCQNCRT